MELLKNAAASNIRFAIEKNYKLVIIFGLNNKFIMV